MLNPWALTSFKAVPERDTRQFSASAYRVGGFAINVLSSAHAKQRSSLGLRHPHVATPFREFFPGHISTYPIVSPAPLCSFFSKSATIGRCSRRKLRFCVKSVARARELTGTFRAGAVLLRHLVGIYSWTNTKTGKIYIGSSVNCARRMTEHRSRLRRGSHANAKLQAAWSKYGEPAFEFRMVFTVLQRADLEKVEQQFLDEYGAVLNGYNLAPTAGNTFGWVATPETRARMSQAAKRRDNSLQVEAMRRASTGKKRPAHVIEAIRKAKTGTKPSAETRARMSLSARNRPERGPEWRERMSQIAKAKTRYSQEDRREMARLKAEGMTLREIGERFGACQSLVSRYVREARSSEA